MNVRETVENAFIQEWKLLGGVELTGRYLKAIADEFRLDSVQIQVDVDVQQQHVDFRLQTERHHIVTLRHLAKTYASHLYSQSGNGAQIDSGSIRDAKILLRSSRECPVYPCG